MPTGIGPARRRRALGRRWFPRAHGDRPPAVSPKAPEGEVSPCPRGSAIVKGRSGRYEHGFPVPTGIGLWSALEYRSARWFPRAHGDRPVVWIEAEGAKPVSPCPRGSAASGPPQRRGAHGFPVPTGIGRRSGASFRHLVRFPRAHGDRPLDWIIALRKEEVSPCPRGSARAQIIAETLDPGFPVPTGIGPSPSTALFCQAGFPRAHGDRPDADGMLVNFWRVSPCPRGSASERVAGDGGNLGFPVPTGIGPPFCRACRPRWRFPRAHGDRPYAYGRGDVRHRVSPCPRGSARLHLPRRAVGAGFPVPTGIGPASGEPTPATRRFPRAHGDRPISGPASVAHGQVSPCPRGSAYGSVDRRYEMSGFPVPTGIGPRSRAPLRRSRRFPRAHGDRPPPEWTGVDFVPVSPCPRGSARPS